MMKQIYFFILIFGASSLHAALITKKELIDACHQPVTIYTKIGPLKASVFTKVVKPPQCTGWRVLDYFIVMWGPSEHFSCSQIGTCAQSVQSPHRYSTIYSQNFVKEERVEGEVAKVKFYQTEQEFSEQEEELKSEMR